MKCKADTPSTFSKYDSNDQYQRNEMIRGKIIVAYKNAKIKFVRSILKDKRL